jgi:hypothetical protein
MNICAGKKHPECRPLFPVVAILHPRPATVQLGKSSHERKADSHPA